MTKQFDVGPQSLPGRAAEFANQINTHGGSTLHIASGRFVQPGSDSGYMVGGHPYAGTSTRIPETQTGNSRIGSFDSAVHLVKSAIHSAATANGTDPTAHSGGWQEDGQVVLDASTRFGNKRDATRAAQSRGEREVFDVKKFDTYKTPKSRAGAKA